MTKELSEKEIRLIELLRKVPFGNVTILMQNGQPYRIEKMTESIIL